jgi:hypothetical protein
MNKKATCFNADVAFTTVLNRLSNPTTDVSVAGEV